MGCFVVLSCAHEPPLLGLLGHHGFLQSTNTHIYLGVHMASCAKCIHICKKTPHSYVTDTVVTEKHINIGLHTGEDLDTNLYICMYTRIHTCWHTQIYTPACVHRYNVCIYGETCDVIQTHT